MKFNINKLSESSDINNNCFDESTESFLYTMLEFNDTLHEIDIQDKINYYRDLKESCDREDNGLEPVNEIVGTIAVVAITAIIAAICAAIGKVISLFTQSKKVAEDMKSKVDQAFNEAKKRASTYTEKIKGKEEEAFTLYTKKEFTMYKCLDHIQEFGDAFNRSVQNLAANTRMAVIGGIDENKDPKGAVDMAYRTLNKLIPRMSGNRKDYTEDIVDASSFRKYMTENFVYEYTETITAAEYLNRFESIKEIGSGNAIDTLKSMKRELEVCKNTLEANKDKMTEQKKKTAQAYVNALKNVVNAGLFVLNKNNSNFMHYAKDAYRVANQLNRPTNSGNYTAKPDDIPNVVESGLIHGEEFNSNTLFANKDMRDFNPTEWLDLELTTECFEAKFILDEAYRRIALQEAMILTDNDFQKFERLKSMREAEAEKANDGLKGVIEVIKNAINKFLDKLKNVNLKNLNILNRNKGFLNQPFIIEKVVSEGDILAGMYRIQKDINLIPFNYEQLKNDLTDKKVFFSKHVIQTLGTTNSNYSKRTVKWDDNMTIVDYCKAYYGGRLDPKKYPKCEFNTKDLEDNRENMIKFLENPSVLNKTRALQAKLESEYKKVTASVANPVTTTTTTNTTNNNSGNTKQTPASGNAASNNNNTTVQHNSYYSNLYNAVFTEADIEKGQTQTANNNQNNAVATADDNGAANKASNESAAFKVYVECYKDVILAKLTAAEFINSELFQIMIAHAESHMNTQQLENERQLRKNEKENNNQAANNNNQNNNQ